MGSRRGLMYKDGAGVPQNDVMAYMCMNLAASRIDRQWRKRAVEFRDEIAARLAPDQLAEGQRLASSGTPRTHVTKFLP